MLQLTEQCERVEHQMSHLSVSEQGTKDVKRVNEKPGKPNAKQRSTGNKQGRHRFKLLWIEWAPSWRSKMACLRSDLHKV